jgi:hypothetical protein
MVAVVGVLLVLPEVLAVIVVHLVLPEVFAAVVVRAVVHLHAVSDPVVAVVGLVLTQVQAGVQAGRQETAVFQDVEFWPEAGLLACGHVWTLSGKDLSGSRAEHPPLLCRCPSEAEV